MQEDSKYYEFKIDIDETKRYSIIQFSRNLEKLNNRELSHIESLGFFSFYGQIEDDFLNNYLFSLQDNISEKLRTLKKFYSHYYPQEIGTETGKKLQSLSNSIKNKIEKSVIDESKKSGLFKVIKGEYENLVVELKEFGKEKSKCVAYIFGKDHPLEINSKYLEPSDIDNEIFRFGENYIRTNYLENSKKEILLDSNFVLFSSLLNNITLYSEDLKEYVGSSYGFYFHLLKIKLLFPEYHIIPIFGNLEEDILKYHRYNSDFSSKSLNEENLNKLMQVLKKDQRWSLEFCSNLGYTIIKEDSSTRSIISSIDIPEHSIIYSRDHALDQLISSSLDLFKFKDGEESYDQHLTYSDIDYDIITMRSIKGCDYVNLKKLESGHLSMLLELIQKYGLKQGMERCWVNHKINKFLKNDFYENRNFLEIKENFKNFRRIMSSIDKNKARSLLEQNSFYREASIFDNIFPILISNI